MPSEAELKALDIQKEEKIKSLKKQYENEISEFQKKSGRQF